MRPKILYFPDPKHLAIINLERSRAGKPLLLSNTKPQTKTKPEGRLIKFEF